MTVTVVSDPLPAPKGDGGEVLSVNATWVTSYSLTGRRRSTGITGSTCGTVGGDDSLLVVQQRSATYYCRASSELEQEMTAGLRGRQILILLEKSGLQTMDLSL